MARTKENLGLSAVLAELKANGTSQNVKIFRNHGVQGELLGVSYTFLKKLHKRVGTDHDLALQLWATGIHDARVFACWVADSERVTMGQLESFAREVDSHAIAYEVVSLAQDTDFAPRLMRKWLGMKAEWRACLGWSVLARLAMQPARPLTEGGLDEAEIGELLVRLEAGIHAAPNRTRHDMNAALIAIGCRPGWQKKATAAARRIGKVEVDYGKTSCKVNDAATKIQKTVEKYKAKGKLPTDGAAGQRRRHC